MTDLIDTTEMYLRTVFELEEEGIPALRARIAERLDHSGPTVSQTIARMERDGLIQVGDERLLVLTSLGRLAAERVMRKHRLAECLLIDVIKLPLELVHEEACRWEHVISNEVERRIYQMLNEPQLSPFGNPIPGLDDLGVHSEHLERSIPESISSLAKSGVRRVKLERFGEPLQSAHETMNDLLKNGIVPESIVRIREEGKIIIIISTEGEVLLTHEEATHLFGVAIN
ncbi:MAG: dihydrofolate reductase [Actinobacteria bacterium]|nr:MAG: dihydrofolate reductase [Actinomycetota bacterium]